MSIQFGELLLVKHRPQALERGQPEVMRTLGADAEILGEILRVDDRVALGALDPEPLRDTAGLVRRDDWFARLLEPRHVGSLAERRTERATATPRHRENSLKKSSRCLCASVARTGRLSSSFSERSSAYLWSFLQLAEPDPRARRRRYPRRTATFRLREAASRCNERKNAGTPR